MERKNLRGAVLIALVIVASVTRPWSFDTKAATQASRHKPYITVGKPMIGMQESCCSVG